MIGTMIGQSLGILMRKDWRLCRLPVLSSIILSVLVYGFAIGEALLRWKLLRFQAFDHLLLNLLWASTVGLESTAFLAAVLGGMAFSVERREHWGDFLSVLPPSRSQVVWSKLFVAWIWL